MQGIRSQNSAGLNLDHLAHKSVLVLEVVIKLRSARPGRFHHLVETYALCALRVDQFSGCFDNAPFGRRPSRGQSALYRLCVSTHRLGTIKMDWTVHFGYRMSGLISPDRDVAMT